MARPPSSNDDRLINASTKIAIAVAIDKDKNSQYAVKWTIDHLLITNPQSHITLIHVTNRFLPNQGLGLNDASSDAYRESTDDIQQLFIPYRGYCARKGVQIREVVLDDFDISKALIDYLNYTHYINNIVVGASARNSITRKFRNPDVATCLTKSAPDFCTVFVISKGKVVSVRSATRLPPLNGMHVASPIPSPRELEPSPKPLVELFQGPEHSKLDCSIRRSSNGRGSSSGNGNGNGNGNEREMWRGTAGPARRVLQRSVGRELVIRAPRTRNTIDNLSMENLDLLSIRLPRNSSSCNSLDSDFSCSSLGFPSIDIDYDDVDFSGVSDVYSPNSRSFSSNTKRDIELEMKRLRLELKQTMDMYSTACNEAITAKQKAREINQWKIEEARKVEEARLAEEAALAIAEMEKVKCRAAIEAAEAARKRAEREASRRRHAEFKAKREAEERMKALVVLQNNDARYRRYTIEEIEAATNFFNASLKIGEGGYGPVYKATLDHTPVAIKVLRPNAKHGRQQFQQEVEVLSCIRHPNMVLLLGACPEYGCLVYEYMENGSLEDRLYRRGNTMSIPWRIRFKIAAEIATALLFLHQTKPEPIVHRDLKPANILLDRNYVGKISDVGLARLVPPSVADSVTQCRLTSAAGTFCYIDPEYQQTGMLCTQSDIYSLGILLLQVITAKPPMGLKHHTEKAIENGTIKELLDPTVSDWPYEETLEYAKVAVKCAELRRKDRPDLASVVLPILNRLSELGNKDETNYPSYISLSYGPCSKNHSSSRSRFCNQELTENNPNMGSQRRSVSQESGSNSSPRAVNGHGRFVPRRLHASGDAPTVVEETYEKK